MNSQVDINEVLSDFRNWQIIDVRSPAEFEAGHIPGAVSLPLFTDEERAVIGTLYKQVSPESAMKEGLQIAGLHMNEYMEVISPYLKDVNKKNVVHCWRGGKRSEAIHWLLSFNGVKVSRLLGGYKSYRSSLQSFFADNNLKLRILGGYTGSGKTEILKEMSFKGQQVIDLESLANHKGSAFGSIGEALQPTNEQFENNLFSEFAALDLTRPIWLENESRNIGKVYLPESLWIRMRKSILYNIDVDRSTRLERALAYYSIPVDMDQLKLCFEKIRKRLGGLEYQNAIKALEENDLKTAASIALAYYDKSYGFQLENWDTDRVVQLPASTSVSATATFLIEI